MPILKFFGLEEEHITKYSKKIQELATLVEAKPESILYIFVDSKIVSSNNNDKKIYVEVEWICRTTNLRERMVKHLNDNFAFLNKKISVNFKDINRNYYVDKEMIG